MPRKDKKPKTTIVEDMSDDPSDSDSGGVSLQGFLDATDDLKSVQHVKQPAQVEQPQHKLLSTKNSSNGQNLDGDAMSIQQKADNITQLEQGLKDLTVQTQDDSKALDIAPKPQPKHKVTGNLYTPKYKEGLEIPPTTRVTRSQTKALEKVAPVSKKSSLNNERDPSNPLLKLLPRPVPTAAYLEQARKPPSKTTTPRPLLIIVDLNGCLLDRGAKKGSKAQLRPHLAQLIEYCLTDQHIMVWSSATPTNVANMSQQVFYAHSKRPLAIWNRTSLHLSAAQASQKVQVYKQLQWIWEDDNIARFHPNFHAGRRWDQTNTILLDDSLEKAAAQPFNHLLVPEYSKLNDARERDAKVLLSVLEYVKEAALHEDVSAFICCLPFDKWMSGMSAVSGFTA